MVRPEKSLHYWFIDPSKGVSTGRMYTGSCDNHFKTGNSFNKATTSFCVLKDLSAL